MAEVPIASQFADVAVKQNAAKFYKISSFIIADAVVRIPLAALDAFIYGSMIYWMSGLAPDGGRYLFFVLAIAVMTYVAVLVERAPSTVWLS